MPSGITCANVDPDPCDGLVQERRNPGVLAMELRLSCTNQPHVAVWRPSVSHQGNYRTADILHIFTIICEMVVAL